MKKTTTKEWILVVITLAIAGFAILVGLGVIEIGEAGISLVK